MSERSLAGGSGAFLRSINVQLDADDPERIAHFRPTAKSVQLLQAITHQQSERAFLVSAPYGSGKSITTGYSLQLVENRDDAHGVILSLEERLREISPGLAELSADRRRMGVQGLFLALHGQASSLVDGLIEAALASFKRLGVTHQGKALRSVRGAGEAGRLLAVLNKIRDIVDRKGLDRVAIVWDEFGRHLEAVVAAGDSRRLIELQTLAEYVSRQNDTPFSLVLLLHQGLLSYATGVSQSQRNEWKKIEGRFEVLQYVDDGPEMYRLLADLIAAHRRTKDLTQRAAAKKARSSREVGLFPDIPPEQLAPILRAAAPLQPATLFLLPRLASRVAQNERTSFSFVLESDLSQLVSPAALFDYFAAEMRSDTGAGGTYRQWLETESALSKLEPASVESIAIKTACLLGLGTGGARSHASRKLLTFVLEENSTEDPSVVLDRLVGQKLLLHRRHSDEISVWHGADQDLRGRLEEERAANSNHFDYIDFIARELPPAPWTPVQYNSENFIHRFFPCQVVDLLTLKYWAEALSPDSDGVALSAGEDGRIVYVCADDEAGIREAVRLVTKVGVWENSRLFFAIPVEPLPLASLALELFSLGRMEADSDLLDSDPLVAPELQQMIEDARSQLKKVLDRLLIPSRSDNQWFCEGNAVIVPSPRVLRMNLSAVMAERFQQTPILKNELIVREKPSPVVINARKKLILGILERSGLENLGIVGNFPDASMFRTLLLHTGIYRQKGGRWDWAAAVEVEDPNLRAVWEQFQEFLTQPKEDESLQQLINRLREPPFGLRSGVLPILFSAALRAFPSTLTITSEGAYLPDILPSDIESIFRRPSSYLFTVVELSREERVFLVGVVRIFEDETLGSTERDLIRRSYDAIQLWRAALPPGCQSTRRASKSAVELFRVINSSSDPVALLFERLAEFGPETDSLVERLPSIRKAAGELTDLPELYASEAGSTLKRCLPKLDEGMDLRVMAKAWADSFPRELKDPLLSRLRFGYRSDRMLLDSLADLLTERPIQRWDDNAATAFADQLARAVKSIEDRALESQEFLERASDEERSRLEQLVTQRISALEDKLCLLQRLAGRGASKRQSEQVGAD